MIIIRALVPVVRDLLGMIVFVILFFATDIYIATAGGIALIAVQTVYMRIRRHPIGALQWMSLVLVGTLGCATIAFHSPYFIMNKPTLMWAALGVVMLRREWMQPYLPPVVTENLDARRIATAGYVYAALLFVLAAMNFAVALLASQTFWAIYALAVPTATQGALFAVLYLRLRKEIAIRQRERIA